MRCPKCSRISPNGYNRCVYCGATLSRETSREKVKNQKLIQCSYCQSEIPEGSGYCRVCGMRLSEGVAPTINKSVKDQHNIDNRIDPQNQKGQEQGNDTVMPDFEKGMHSFSVKKTTKEPVNSNDLGQENDNKDTKSQIVGTNSPSPNKRSFIPVAIIAGVFLLAVVILCNQKSGGGFQPHSNDKADNTDYLDDSYTDDSDYSGDSYTDDSDLFAVDYSKVLDLSNYEYIDTENFSFYAPTSLYDSAEIMESLNLYYYSSEYSGGEDYISFTSTPYGKYYYSFDSPDELLDIMCNEYPEEEINIILKKYQSESSDGIGRLVYDLPNENLYCAISFCDYSVYEMDISHRDPKSDEEARWMDYYINVLYRGCSFTRNVGPMYTYEEYLKEQ